MFPELNAYMDSIVMMSQACNDALSNCYWYPKASFHNWTKKAIKVN